MDVSGQRRWILGLLVAFASLRGAGDRPCATPAPSQLLEDAGLRLSQSLSAEALTQLAYNGHLLLDALTRAERSALARGGLRFQVSAPAEVFLAAAEQAPPFWLGERGFEPTPVQLENEDTRWRVFRRQVPAGLVELGVNGLDQTPASHYVVFVRPLHRETGAEVTLDSRSASRFRVRASSAQPSAAWDVEHRFGTLPDFLQAAILIQPAHADRHATVLARARVWKTHVVAGQAPDQVVVSFGQDSARTLVWTWRTSRKSPSDWLRLARLPARKATSAAPGQALDIVRTLRSQTEQFPTPSVLNDPVLVRHRAEANGLEPDTRYVYSIGDGTRWSPWQPIKTAPGPGKRTRFLYLGDAQTGFPGWGKLLATASARVPDADFLLIAGDLVDRGNERTNWDHFFLRAAGVFDRIPLMPCVGNHEYLDRGPQLYQAYFELPGNGPAGSGKDLVYSFTCGDVLLAVLDSTIAAASARAAKQQADWLDQVLTASTARFKIVAFHHPLYPSHPWRDVPGLRSAWIPVLDRHGVDLVLQGHDHAYLRTYPMRGDRRATAKERGTIYVIAVSGDKFVPEQPARDYIEVGRTSTSTYQVIDVDPATDRLRFEAWTETGEQIDAFVLEKPRGSDTIARGPGGHLR